MHQLSSTHCQSVLQIVQVVESNFPHIIVLKCSPEVRDGFLNHSVIHWKFFKIYYSKQTTDYIYRCMNTTRWSEPTAALINSGEHESTTEITMLVSIYRVQVPLFKKKRISKMNPTLRYKLFPG